MLGAPNVRSQLSYRSGAQQTRVSSLVLGSRSYSFGVHSYSLVADLTRLGCVLLPFTNQFSYMYECISLWVPLSVTLNDTLPVCLYLVLAAAAPTVTLLASISAARTWRCGRVGALDGLEDHPKLVSAIRHLLCDH